MNTLMNKRVVLGITGSIAAYKGADLVRQLRRVGAEVRVIMTPSAKRFVAPLTFQTLSGNPVQAHLFDNDDVAPDAAGIEHIDLARWADVVLIAPASADFLARLAQGRANDLLTSVCLATSVPVAVAPAMNRQMWENPKTQRHVQALCKKGAKKTQVFGPAEGFQACGESGLGRMLEPVELVEALAGFFDTGILSGWRVLVTAGPTREYIDPVRFISNRSSGRMGYALAEAAVEAGAQITLISGPVHLEAPDRVKRIDVISAQEMRDATIAEVGGCDIVIGAAAVADYRCVSTADKKIKKAQAQLTMQLERNPDILLELSGLKTRPFLVGFSAETERLIENAKRKLQEKNLDMIVANRVGDGIGFECDENAVTVLWKNGRQVFPKAAKGQLAQNLIDLIASRFHEHGRRVKSKCEKMNVKKDRIKNTG